jgi:hypothetical protein
MAQPIESESLQKNCSRASAVSRGIVIHEETNALKGASVSKSEDDGPRTVGLKKGDAGLRRGGLRKEAVVLNVSSIGRAGVASTKDGAMASGSVNAATKIAATVLGPSAPTKGQGIFRFPDVNARAFMISWCVGASSLRA